MIPMESVAMKRLASNFVVALSLLLCLATTALWSRAGRLPWLLHSDEEGFIAVAATAKRVEIQNHWSATVPEPDRFGWSRKDNPFISLFGAVERLKLALENSQRLAVDSQFDRLSFGYRSVSVKEFDGRLASRSSAVAVPYWALMLAGLAYPAARLATMGGRRRRRRLAAGLCVNCGYDLRASAGRCPECGNIQPAAASSKV
jgi:hypothetical protein